MINHDLEIYHRFLLDLEDVDVEPGSNPGTDP